MEPRDTRVEVAVGLAACEIRLPERMADAVFAESDVALLRSKELSVVFVETKMVNGDGIVPGALSSKSHIPDVFAHSHNP